MKKPSGSGGPKIIYMGGRPYCGICFRKTGLYNPVQGGRCRGCDRRPIPTPAPTGGSTAPTPAPAGGSRTPTPKVGRARVRIVYGGLPGLGKRR